MLKLILISICFFQLVFAKYITFSEKKYIYALDNQFNKNGKLTIDTQKVVLEYPKNKKKVIYTKDLIQIINNGIKENFTHEKNIQYDLFFRLIIAIYNNDVKQLQKKFQIKKDKSKVTLIPNGKISSVIGKISFKKIKERLQYLIIYFVNQDRITIEQTN